MTAESAFRPYYKPAVPHTSAGYEQMMMQQRNLYSSPEPRVSSSSPSTCGGKSEKARRRRTTFTPEQTFALEREYVTDRYMDSAKRAHLAEVLQLNEIQVKTWFQNRRAKDKKEGKTGNSESPREMQRQTAAFDQQPNGSSDVPQQQQQPLAQESAQTAIYEKKEDAVGEQKEETVMAAPAVANTPQLVNPYASIMTPVVPNNSISPIDKKLLLNHPALKAALDSPAQTPRSSPPSSIMTSVASNTVVTPPATTSPQFENSVKQDPQQFIPSYKFGGEDGTSVPQPQPIAGAPNSYAEYLMGIRQIPMPTYAPMYDMYAAAANPNIGNYGLDGGIFLAALAQHQVHQQQQQHHHQQQQQQHQSLTNL